jgi:organic radical activating enzyme
MTLADFKKVLDFQEKSNISDVRLLGGEPTIHPQFKEIVEEAYKRRHVKHIQLFTNGLFNYATFEVLKEASKYVSISVLINYNSPKILGPKKVEKIESNISKLVKIGQVTLGINFYKPDQEYEYIIKSSLKHRLNNVRFAVVIPNTIQKAQEDIKGYFSSFTPLLIKFFGVCAMSRLSAKPDCNNTPLCIWDDEQLRLLAMVGQSTLKINLCKPVIDVKTDLSVIRCFGMSDTQANLEDFNNIGEVDRYFQERVDKQYDNVDIFEECKACAIKEVHGKGCGCLAYKKVLKRDKHSLLHEMTKDGAL